MNRATRLPAHTVVVTAILALAPLAARAENPLFYAGGSAGQANVKVGQIAFNETDIGWKLLVGTRPIDLLGAELAYIDFGKPSTSSTGVNSNAAIKGAALHGLIYLPLPTPDTDVYAKLGLARLESSAAAYNSGCNGSGPGCNLFAFNRTNTQPTYGAGAQFHFGAFAARIEYEHFQTYGGSPSLLSAGLTYQFL